MNRKDYALEVIYGTSRGQDTYGWNIVSLRDNWEHKKRYRTCGGGYDMLGTVFAYWLQENYMDRIKAKLKPIDYDVENTDRQVREYGFFKKGESYWLDGACGFDCLKSIAIKVGLEVRSNYNQRRKCTDYIFVRDTLAE